MSGSLPSVERDSQAVLLLQLSFCALLQGAVIRGNEWGRWSVQTTTRFLFKWKHFHCLIAFWNRKALKTDGDGYGCLRERDKENRKEDRREEEGERCV